MRQSVLGGGPQQGDEEWFERGDGVLVPVRWLATPCETIGGEQATLVLFHPAESPERPAQQFVRAIGDHFVRVHVVRRARARLEHIDHELLAKAAVGDLPRNLRNCVSPPLIELAQFKVGPRRGQLDQRRRPHVLRVRPHA